MFSNLPTYIIYQLFAVMVILGLSLLPNNTTFAQEQQPNSVRSVVKTVRGSIVECSGGLTIDLSQAEFESDFSRAIKTSDLTPGTIISADGQFLSNQSSPSQTFFKATEAFVQIPQQIKVAAPIQKIDATRNTITILNKEVSIGAETKLFQRKKKKLKPITFPSLSNGQRITVEMLLQADGSLVIQKAVQGLDPGNIDPILIGFIEEINGTVLTFAGNFTTDSKVLSNFPVEVTTGLFAQVNIPEMFAITNQEPYPSFALAISSKALLFIGGIEKIDLSKQTINLFGREIQITPDTKYFGVNSLNKVKLNFRDTAVEIKETANGLEAVYISQ